MQANGNKLKTVLCVAVLALFVAAACGSDGGGGSSAPNTAGSGQSGPAPGVVRVGVGGALAGLFPSQDGALALGLYDQVAEEYGTEFEFTAFTGATELVSALNGGSLDLGLFSGVALPPQTVQGFELSGFFEMTRRLPFAVVARSEFQGDRGTGVEALRRFEGSTWGVPTAGGPPELALAAAVESLGITWTDEDVVALGNTTAIPAAFQAGRVDIAVMDNNSASRIVESGDGYIVYNLVDKDTENVFGDLIGLVVAGRTAFGEEYPQLTSSIMGVHIEGLRHMQGLRTDAGSAYEAYPQEFRDNTPFQRFEVYWPQYSAATTDVTGLFSPKAVEDTVNYLKKTGALEAGAVVPASTFENRYTEAAYRELGLPVPS